MSKGTLVYIPEVGYGFIVETAKGMLLVSLDKLKGAVRWFLEGEVEMGGEEIKIR